MLGSILEKNNVPLLMPLRPNHLESTTYFENNKQNIFSYLELFILENSSFFACYLPTIFLKKAYRLLFYITGTDDQGMNRYVFVQNIFLRVQTSFTVIFTPPFQTF